MTGKRRSIVQRIETLALCMCSLIVFFAIYSGIVNNFRFSRFVRWVLSPVIASTPDPVCALTVFTLSCNRSFLTVSELALHAALARHVDKLRTACVCRFNALQSILLDIILM